MALPSQRTKGSFWDSAVSDRTSEIGARSGPRSHPDADSSASPSPNHIGKALPNASLRHGRKTRLRSMDSTCVSRSRPFAIRIIRSATLLGGVCRYRQVVGMKNLSANGRHGGAPQAHSHVGGLLTY